MRDAVGPDSVLSQISTPRSWIAPDIKKKKKLLYVSDAGVEWHEKHGRIDIFSVPGYSMVGQITKGVDGPDGLTVDKKGNLYVGNGFNRTITVYKPGSTGPSLTLTQSYSPRDVAVASNGYVYVSDAYGGVDVYPPGATSPSSRLSNPALNDAGVSPWTRQTMSTLTETATPRLRVS
jgi:hypothetical protein